MSEQTTNFYIFHGDDDIAIDQAVQKIRSQMGDDINAEMNISEFDGQAVIVPEVINAVSSFPFLADKRLAIVKGMVSWITRRGAGATGKKSVTQLEESLPKLPAHARLVFVERGKIADNNKLIKLATSAPNGYVKAFTMPKDPSRWIKQRAKSEYDKDIDNAAVNALATVTGGDLRIIDNELAKLASYIGDSANITEDDVASLTPYVPEANIFKMVDAIAEGRGRLALSLLHRLLQEKDQDAFKIFGMVIRQFRLLLLAKEHLSTGGTPGSIASAIGVRPFVAQNLARQTRAFEVIQLEGIYRSLLDNDYKIKTGRIQADLALDLFITSIAK